MSLFQGQPEYEDISLGNHVFKLKALGGFSLKFEETDKNEVTAVNFIQPKGTFKTSKKKYVPTLTFNIAQDGEKNSIKIKTSEDIRYADVLFLLIKKERCRLE